MCRRRYQSIHHNYHQEQLPPSPSSQLAPSHPPPTNSPFTKRHTTRTPPCIKATHHQGAPIPSPQTHRLHTTTTTPMAALLIGAIAIGSHKIKQKRDERKKQRAIDEWGAQQVALRSQEQEQEREAGRPRRKSEEAGERRSSEEGEAPPPAYEDAVAQGRRERAAATRGHGAVRAHAGAGGMSMLRVGPLGSAER